MKKLLLQQGGRFINKIIYNPNYTFARSLLQRLLGDWNFYRLLSSMAEAGLKDEYNTKPTPGQMFKGVVVMFDGREGQPGLADCLRGICSIFQICQSLNVPFKVCYTKPFELSKYLLPSSYDWRIEPKELSFNTDYSKPVCAISYSNIFGDNNVHLQKRYIETVIRKHPGQQLHVFSNTYCYDPCFHDNFHRLFKPSATLEELIGAQFSAIGGKYVSASFRFANLLGDIKDTYGRELSAEEKNRLIDKCVDSIIQIKQKHSDIEKVLVTSDSNTFITAVLERLDYIYVIEGKIGHLAHEGDDSVVVKTFLDMYLISKAETVYMVRTAEMYRSGFARRASMMGNKPFVEVLV